MLRTELLLGVFCLAGILLLGVALGGCGEDTQGGKGEHTAYVAMGINDGATAKVGSQGTCPVCGEPIVPEYHTASKEARVYFDCQECLEKYEANPGEYKQKLMEQKVFSNPDAE